MTKFYGRWVAGSSHCEKPLHSENKTELIKTLKTIAKGNCPMGRGYFWEVSTLEGDSQVVVARGGTNMWGQNWREDRGIDF